jgi:hypothetical protein
MKKPVVFAFYNRPQLMLEAFEAIRAYKPDKLFLIADGPKASAHEDVLKCQEARQIVDTVDWQCEIHRLYSRENIGLKKRISSGLDWVFTNTDAAIVLEDDCVAHGDFFRFCEAMLDHYTNESKVMCITGNNFQNGRIYGRASYYFSKYPHCWGWATWARAWRHFDQSISFWPEYRQSRELRDLNKQPSELQYWSNIFDDVYSGKRNSWAFPWTASVWHAGGVTVTPQVNLVVNIGFGAAATHTTSSHAEKQQAGPIAFPLVHENELKVDEKADLFVFHNVFRRNDCVHKSEDSMLLRLANKAMRSLRKRLALGK